MNERTETGYYVQGIPSHLVDHFWHYAEPYVKRALDHAFGELMAEDLRIACKERNVQLWLVRQGARIVGAATTEIVIYPQRKHCRIITIAGSSFNEWCDMADNIVVAWAIQQGCNGIEAHVRKGFVKKLEELDYKHRNCVVVKKLDIIEPASATLSQE